MCTLSNAGLNSDPFHCVIPPEGPMNATWSHASPPLDPPYSPGDSDRNSRGIPGPLFVLRPAFLWTCSWARLGMPIQGKENGYVNHCVWVQAETCAEIRRIR